MSTLDRSLSSHRLQELRVEGRSLGLTERLEQWGAMRLPSLDGSFAEATSARSA